MSSKFLVIRDSEDEDSDDNNYHEGNSINPPSPAPLVAPAASTLYIQSLPSSKPSQISGETREKAIKEAQYLLLANTPGTPEAPGMQPPSVKAATAGRRKTTDGRLEGSFGKGMDVYDFPIDDEDDEDFEPPSSKRRKRPTKMVKSVIEGSEDSSYEGQKAKPRKKRESTVARRSKSTPDVLPGECSGDDWAPSSKIKKPAGRKPTRSNAGEKELAPLLPKPRRKLGGDFDGDLGLGIDTDRLPKRGGGGSTFRTVGNEPGANSFMIDLTNEDLILATQTKAEYDALSPNQTESHDTTTLLVNFEGRGSDAEEYEALSTIPDPPDESGQSQPLDLRYNDFSASLQSHLSPRPPPLSVNMASSPLSSPPTAESAVEPASPAANYKALDGAQLGRSPSLAKNKRVPKRNATDQGLNTEGFGRVASEWRAAKGRSKTMDDVILLSDDDHFAREIPEKKKKAVRQKKAPKSTASATEGTKKGAKGGAAVKKGKAKGKAAFSAVINDSEDDGAFSNEEPIQKPVSDNNNNENLNDTISVEPTLNADNGVPKEQPGDQVMVAVAIESPSKGVQLGAQKHTGVAYSEAEDNTSVDMLKSNVIDVHKELSMDLEPAPSSPHAAVLAKRAASGAGGGRKKRTKQEMEDEEDWADKPGKKLPGKATPKNKNKVGKQKPRPKAKINAKKDMGQESSEEAQEKPPRKPAPKGRAAKKGKQTGAKAEAVGQDDREGDTEHDSDIARQTSLKRPTPRPKNPKAGKKQRTEPEPTADTEDQASSPETPLRPKSLGAAENQPAKLSPEVEPVVPPPSNPETGGNTTPAPPESKSTPASSSKKPGGKVPFRVGLSRRSKIPSLLKGFKK